MIHTTLSLLPPSLNVHTSISAESVPSKKANIEKTRAEKGLERAMDTFLKYQMEAEERHAKQKEER